MKLKVLLISFILLGFASNGYAQNIYGNSNTSDIYGINQASPPFQSNESNLNDIQEINEEMTPEEIKQKEERRQKRILKYQKKKTEYFVSSLVVGIVGGAGGIGAGVGLLSISTKMNNRIENSTNFNSGYILDLEAASVKNKKLSYVGFAFGGASVATAIVLGILHANIKHKLEKLQVSVVPSISKEQSSLAFSLTF